ncbi:hypothetical protein PR048_017639 [Dryococelus australis]|uniref:Uncharacterized protein n=1 Tax=Dryococelus australis TaxID=614101 RepID=A0ABQ9HAB6_9NEOP|nr:hypothetical protein PR048_017639 [Dryococelus australis]
MQHVDGESRVETFGRILSSRSWEPTRGEYGAVPDGKGGGSGRCMRKPAVQLHHPARFSRANKMRFPTSHFIVITSPQYVLRRQMRVEKGDHLSARPRKDDDEKTGKPLSKGLITTRNTTFSKSTCRKERMNMERHWNDERGDIPEKARRPASSTGTIPTCEGPVTQPGIEPGSSWWEAGVLTTQPPSRKKGVARQNPPANGNVTVFPTCEDPDTPPGIEPGSPWRNIDKKTGDRKCNVYICELIYDYHTQPFGKQNRHSGDSDTLTLHIGVLCYGAITPTHGVRFTCVITQEETSLHDDEMKKFRKYADAKQAS